MFVGHVALALAAKAREPRAPLGLLFAATMGLDLIWPILLLLGVETAHLDSEATAFTPISFDSYPWSHSLAMAIAWGALAAAIAGWSGSPRGVSLLAGGLVVSHWILDAATHRPDMPLWPGPSPLIGLGLWNSIPATFAVEGALFAAGLVVYDRATRPIDRAGSLGFWSLMAACALLWAGSPWSRPPSERVLAWASLVTWLLVLWAAWADRHRVARGSA